MNVFGTVTTVSPGRTPAAISAKRNASVPLATPTACRTSQKSANSRSNSSTIEPPTNPAVLSARRKTDTSSGSSASCCATRSRNGIGRLLAASRSAKRLEANNFPSRLQRPIGRFQNLDDPQAGRAVVDGGLAVHDAVEEVLEFHLQGLGLLDARRPDIARAITHEELVDVVTAGDLHALVVHLDLLVGLEVVPHEHFLFAADQRGPDLDRRQPVDV